MIRYIYGFEPSASAGVIAFLRLFVVADKYNISDLQAKVAKAVKTELRVRVRTITFPAGCGSFTSKRLRVRAKC